VSSVPLLNVVNLHTHYTVPSGIVRAVNGVSFSLAPGETLGLVGESGCGKSTLGKSIARLISPSSGEILFRGTDLAPLSRRQLQPFRKNIQFVFQDPYASLNPRASVQRILEEPLIVHGMSSSKERLSRIFALLERVGLPTDSTTNFPHEFSGGQRQRIGIARALTLEPDLIICDEPVSALDVSVQAQVLNLLADLQKERNYASLFITHDFSVVKYIADRIAVMYLGNIVEIAEPGPIWDHQLHPYTKALISAVPVADPKLARIRNRELLGGEIPSRVAPPPGCSFHPRCPNAMPVCSGKVPELKTVQRDNDIAQVACHLYA
jgi:oligopeptide/dipeptide ABC transporter ATP-binding protein